MKTYQATQQPKVFIDCASGEYFEHDGQHPSSVEFGLLQQAGQAQVIPAVVLGYSEKRGAAYRQEIEASEAIEAIFEYLAENRPEKLQKIQAKRQAIKSRFPSPR